MVDYAHPPILAPPPHVGSPQKFPPPKGPPRILVTRKVFWRIVLTGKAVLKFFKILKNALNPSKGGSPPAESGSPPVRW